jgi:hypothetical protein
VRRDRQRRVQVVPGARGIHGAGSSKRAARRGRGAGWPSDEPGVITWEIARGDSESVQESDHGAGRRSKRWQRGSHNAHNSPSRRGRAGARARTESRVEGEEKKEEEEEEEERKTRRRAEQWRGRRTEVKFWTLGPVDGDFSPSQRPTNEGGQHAERVETTEGVLAALLREFGRRLVCPRKGSRRRMWGCL